MKRPLWIAALCGAAAFLAVLNVAAFLAGCSGTSGDTDSSSAAGHTPAADEVRLVVSRDFGAEIMRDIVTSADDGLDVMRLLAENADVDTGYGGGFVKSIDGLESSFGAGSAGDAADWFYWVDGILADVGAADWKLTGGETVWWDYHRWADAMVLPMALHAFPRPYSRAPLTVTGSVDVAGLDDWGATVGLELGPRHELTDKSPGGLVLATADDAANTPWIADLIQSSRTGIEFVRLENGTLRLLSPGGDAGPSASAVALPVTNPDDPDAPFLLVLATSADELGAFVPKLTPDALDATVGVALIEGGIVHLPWQG